MRLGIFSGLVFLAGVGAGAFAFFTADDLPKAAQKAQTYWAGVEEEFLHRAEFVPAIIAAIESVSPSQADLIGKVKAAQAAVLALAPDPQAPADIKRFRGYMLVQDNLSRHLGLVLDMLQLYPEKVRTGAVAKTFDDLERKESHVVVARGDYVAQATAHNSMLSNPPQSWVASYFHPEAKPLVASFDTLHQ